METANKRGHPKRGRWFYLKPGKWVRFNSVRWPRRAMRFLSIVLFCVAAILFIDTSEIFMAFQRVLEVDPKFFVGLPLIGLVLIGGGEGGKTLFHKQLGARLRMFREAKRISQIELAQACGYNSTGTISQIERGISGMEVSKLVRAAAFLGIHPAALLTELNLTDEQLKQLSKFALLIQHPEKAKNLDAILTLLKTEEV
mgnify:CR=1 FL=1